MKALSLTAPWAHLIAIGAKRYETRSANFPRRHHGELAIVSSMGFPPDMPRSYCKQLSKQEPFAEALRRADLTFDRLALGYVLAVVQVVGYCNAQDVSPSATHPRCYSWRSPDWAVRADPAAHDHAFGDYTDGRTIILTGNPRRLRHPVHVVRMRKGLPINGGALGIYTLSPGCEMAVRAEI